MMLVSLKRLAGKLNHPPTSPPCDCGPDADVGPCPSLAAGCPVKRPLEAPEVVTLFLDPKYEGETNSEEFPICGVPAYRHYRANNELAGYESGYIHGKEKLVHEISDVAVVSYAPTGGYANEAVNDVLDALLQADANPHGDECDCPLCRTLAKLSRQQALRRRRRFGAD